MKIKIYLREWFYNAGIIGFLKIIQEANRKEEVNIEENYIEFDTELLEEFDQYYFNYFFQKYNIAEKTILRMQKIKKRVIFILEKEPTSKEEIKIQKEEVKRQKKYLKNVIKTQIDKVKKIDDAIYAKMQERYEQIEDVKEREDIKMLEEIVQDLENNIRIDFINKRLTLNFFKSILSKNYFGQPSFLNVAKTACTYEEQQKIMYQDYVSNIVEMGFINDILENKYSLQEIRKYIEDKLKEQYISKEIQKVYVRLQSNYTVKQKKIEEIQKYIEEKVLGKCSMCENKGIVSQYTESNFIPLAISSDNMKNFFWNQNVKFPVCDVCKLMLFCTPAGITSITKTTKEIDDGKIVYKEKEVYSFVNYDTSIQNLYQTNISFENSSKAEKKIYNPYEELILNIIEQEKQLTDWKLNNIFVIEFETEYLAYSRMKYFNIKKYMAEFFKKYGTGSLGLINDYQYKLEVMDNILKNKEIKYVIDNKLKETFLKKDNKGYDSYLAVKTRVTINKLKKEEGGNMEEEIKKDYKKIYVLYNMGIEIHELLKHRGESNKLDGYMFRLLNSVKLENKKEFMDTVIRLNITLGKDVSPIFLEVMQDNSLDFTSIGHSFISGLVSNKYEKKNEEE